MREYNGTYTIIQKEGSIYVSFSNKKTPVDIPVRVVSRRTQHLPVQPTSLRRFQALIPVTALNKGPQRTLWDEPLHARPRPPCKARHPNFPRRPTARAHVEPRDKTPGMNWTTTVTPLPAAPAPIPILQYSPTRAVSLRPPPRGTRPAPAARRKLAATNDRGPSWLPPTHRREVGPAWPARSAHSAVSQRLAREHRGEATGARRGAPRVRRGPSPPGRARGPAGTLTWTEEPPPPPARARRTRSRGCPSERLTFASRRRGAPRSPSTHRA